MPKSLGIVGTSLAIGSAIGSVVSSRRKDKKVNQAQVNQQNVERKIRAEQATRERRNQYRQARIASANAEAVATATGASDSSGASGAQAGIVSDLNMNLSDINFAQASSNALSSARQDTMNAGMPTALDSLNTAVQPLIFGNVASINKAFG